MASVVEDSSTRTPLIFVLSPGVVSSFVKRSWFSCLYVTDFLAFFHEVMVNIPQILVLKLLDCLISRIFFNRFSFFLKGSDQRLVTACWELWDVKSVPCPLSGSGPGPYSHAYDQRRSERRKFTCALTSEDVLCLSCFFFNFYVGVFIFPNYLVVIFVSGWNLSVWPFKWKLLNSASLLLWILYRTKSF